MNLTPYFRKELLTVQTNTRDKTYRTFAWFPRKTDSGYTVWLSWYVYIVIHRFVTTGRKGLAVKRYIHTYTTQEYVLLKLGK